MAVGCDRINELLYYGGMFSASFLSVTVSLMYYGDVHALFGELLPPYALTISTILFLAYLLLVLYLGIYKWFLYSTQVIPGLYFSLIWIFRQNEKNNFIGLRRITVYKSVYIFIVLMNEVVSLPFISLKVMIVMLTSLSFTIGSIERLSMISYLFILISLIVVVFTNFCLHYGKEIYVRSSMFINNLDNPGTPHLKKIKISLRECRVYAGSLYYIDGEVLPKVNNTIVNYAISNGLMFKSLRC